MKMNIIHVNIIRQVTLDIDGLPSTMLPVSCANCFGWNNIMKIKLKITYYLLGTIYLNKLKHNWWISKIGFRFNSLYSPSIKFPFHQNV